MWSGDKFNARFKKQGKAIHEFPDRKALRNSQGIRCADSHWRWIITIDDAERMGCNLFDKEQLQLEYTPEAYKQLFMCHFIDDSESVFSLAQLLKAQVSPLEWKWLDRVKKEHWPVWIGYDPSRSRDGACIVVVVPPRKIGGKFFVIEKLNLYNKAWQYQAAEIKRLTQEYNVEYIGIDMTGPGSGVYETVSRFFPAAEGIMYSAEVKTKLVLKAQQVITEGRTEWDMDWSDIATGFMQIKKVVAGDKILYKSSRSDTAGHADAAWAIMHVLVHEDLIYDEDEEVVSSLSA
jgi:hypothetical protein